jgi:hypothetical protein
VSCHAYRNRQAGDKQDQCDDRRNDVDQRSDGDHVEPEGLA